MISSMPRRRGTCVRRVTLFAENQYLAHGGLGFRRFDYNVTVLDK
jgi:hypothetical protein